MESAAREIVLVLMMALAGLLLAAAATFAPWHAAQAEVIVEVHPPDPHPAIVSVALPHDRPYATRCPGNVPAGQI